MPPGGRIARRVSHYVSNVADYVLVYLCRPTRSVGQLRLGMDRAVPSAGQDQPERPGSPGLSATKLLDLTINPKHSSSQGFIKGLL